jgi:hypothetical protein
MVERTHLLEKTQMAIIMFDFLDVISIKIEGRALYPSSSWKVSWPASTFDSCFSTEDF